MKTLLVGLSRRMSNSDSTKPDIIFHTAEFEPQPRYLVRKHTTAGHTAATTKIVLISTNVIKIYLLTWF